MSDNGSVPNIPGAKKYTHSYNYPLSRGKWDAMEGGIRVPLIISGPGINSSKEINIPVSESDFYQLYRLSRFKTKYYLMILMVVVLKKSSITTKINFVKRNVSGIFSTFHIKMGLHLKRPHSAIRRRRL